MKRAYDFATIGFRPYPETEEFVTIGLIAVDPLTKVFGYDLIDSKKIGRVTKMFPNIGKELYINALTTLRNELEAVFDTLTYGAAASSNLHEMNDPAGLFNAITTPRHGIFCYPVKGRRLSENMDQLMADLKDRFIQQNHLTPALTPECQMAKQIIQVLRKGGMMNDYKKDIKVGPPQYRVNFTLGQMSGSNKASRVIRPLNFDLKTPTEIYNHGDEWLTKLKRLNSLNYKPDHCLFMVREPTKNSGGQLEVFAVIKKEFEEQGLQFEKETQEDKMIEFARSSKGRPFGVLNL